MPESAECRHQAEFLANKISNKKIKNALILSGRYSKKEFEGYQKFLANLPTNCVGVGVKGKFLYALFENGSLFITLGMSGWFSIKENKHSRFKFITELNDEIYYNDIRNFGTLKWSQDPKELKKKLDSLGPDIANKNKSNDEFINKLKNKKNLNLTISEVLMNQKNIAGIGNYMKAEILYVAKINPNTLIKDLSDMHLYNIITKAREIAQISYDLGGATIKTYRSSNGEPGEFSRRFAVYGQTHDPLGNLVQRIETADKRTTHWVPQIQNNQLI